jgi:hypothetical protein
MVVSNTAQLTATFDILAHSHRRYVLYHLTSNSGAVGIRTLATGIVEWNMRHSGGNRAISTNAVESALYHHHLPKLADAGFVTFDRDAASVALQKSDRLDKFLPDAAVIDGVTHLLLTTGVAKN